MARPQLKIDEDQVRELAMKGCRNSEIALIMGIDDQTLTGRFSRLLDKTRAKRRMALRETQTRKALSGDVTMLIWLGKNELDQTDKVEQAQAGEIMFRVVYEDSPESPDVQGPETAPGAD